MTNHEKNRRLGSTCTQQAQHEFWVCVWKTYALLAQHNDALRVERYDKPRAVREPPTALTATLTSSITCPRPPPPRRRLHLHRRHRPLRLLPWAPFSPISRDLRRSEPPQGASRRFGELAVNIHTSIARDRTYIHRTERQRDRLNRLLRRLAGGILRSPE